MMQANPVRAWDFAATAKSNDNDPDWTVGLKMQRDSGGRFIVLDVVRLRGTPMEVEQVLVTTAARDGIAATIALPQDPGSAGISLASSYIRRLAGYHVVATPETCSKIVRATPLAAQVEGGNLAVVRGDWNLAFLEELREFPLGRKDDQVDALSRAFGHLLNDCAPARKIQINLLSR
jgi:predicted phage terminase large subunit-like protein